MGENKFFASVDTFPVRETDSYARLRGMLRGIIVSFSAKCCRVSRK